MTTVGSSDPPKSFAAPGLVQLGSPCANPVASSEVSVGLSNPTIGFPAPSVDTASVIAELAKPVKGAADLSTGRVTITLKDSPGFNKPLPATANNSLSLTPLKLPLLSVGSIVAVSYTHLTLPTIYSV